MRLKKFLSALVSGVMVLGTLAAVPVFAANNVAKIGETEYATLTEAIESLSTASGDTTITLLADAEYSFGARTNIGNANTSSITIDGDNHVLNLHGTDTDWSSIANAGGKLVFKNMTINKDEGGNGAWNNHSLNIKSYTEFDNVTVNNSVVVYAGGKFTKTNFIETGEYYTLYISANGQEVTVDNCTFTATTGGRGIKVIEQYVTDDGSEVKKVGLKVENSTFNTAKKAAILVTSAAGADIVANNNDITNVAADPNTLVWVDEASDNYNDVVVKDLDGNIIPGAVTVENAVVKLNDVPYASFQKAVDTAQSGDVITLLGNASGNGVKVQSGSNITIDLNGKTYTIDGSTVGSAGTETNGFQLLKNSNITIKNGTITSDKAKILIQNYSNLTLEDVTLDGSKLPGSNHYVLSNNFGNTVLKGNTNITAKDGDVAFDCYYWPKGGYGDGVTVTLGEDFTGIITGKIEKAHDSTVTDAEAAEKSYISIAAGTFTYDISEYVADTSYQKVSEDGKIYTVIPSESSIIDTAKTTGATVTLDGLKNNDTIDHAPDATYQVVVETAPAADAAAANDKIASSNDTNTSKAMFDISVVKTDSNGTKSKVEVENQPVTLTLGETPENPNDVRVYHVDGSTVTEIQRNETDKLTVSGNKVSFIAPSFSTYAVTYNTGTVDAGTIATKVGVVFSKVQNSSNQYYITLKSLEADRKINRFMSTDLVFNNGCATVDYDITPAANMTASVVSENGTSREYRFNMDGTNQSCASSEIGGGITIGTITFYGYGELNFSVNTGYSSGHSVNIVNTATATNNIVASYTLTGGLLVNDDVTGNLADDEKGTIKDVTLAPEKKKLTVNVEYNNGIKMDNTLAYQDMTVTISGGDFSGVKTVKLGKPGDSEVQCVGFAAGENVNVATSGNTYTITVDNELTQNVAYTVTVEGAGYRTARYTVNMAENKVLNFWNNVKDANDFIEVGKDSSKTTKNFLAGDIVKDNQINIYDLSAVVSYFGSAATVDNNYAKYDLNRDGVIDSKDVAYVLVSWGK